MRSLDLQKELYRENEFPSEGTRPDCPPSREQENMAWMAAIKPELETMWEAVTEEDYYGDGSGEQHTRRCFFSEYRFVIFPDNGD